MEKAVVRSAAIFELGEKFEDKLEAKVANINIAKGAAAALSEAQKSIEAIVGHVDKEVDDGKIDLEQAKLIKQWILRCQYTAISLQKSAENKVWIAEGQAQALREIIDQTKKFYDVEQSKIPKEEEASEDSAEVTAQEDTTKRTGRRPSIKSQRQAKAKKKVE